MESIQGFLNRHAVDCVKNAFTEKRQSVELCSTISVGEFLIIDSPEYDFMWHRGTLYVVVNVIFPLRGYVRIRWTGMEGVPGEYANHEFNEHIAFGDALEHLQNSIWNRIDDE